MLPESCYLRVVTWVVTWELLPELLPESCYLRVVTWELLPESCDLSCYLRVVTWGVTWELLPESCYLRCYLRVVTWELWPELLPESCYLSCYLWVACGCERLTLECARSVSPVSGLPHAACPNGTNPSGMIPVSMTTSPAATGNCCYGYRKWRSWAVAVILQSSCKEILARRVYIIVCLHVYFSLVGNLDSCHFYLSM